MSHFLITTALEETWVNDQPVLFLGEWCRLYARKSKWSSLKSSVVPYHWDDRNQLYADYQYLQKFYERVLRELATHLNQLHGVKFSLRYWRILIGPWLAYLIQMLFDRWVTIHDAISNFDINGTIILTGNEDALVPNDMGHFADLMLNDEWNHHIYSAILESVGNVPCIKKPVKSKLNIQKTCSVGLKKKIVTTYSGIASHFVGENDAFFVGTYLPLFEDIRLYIRFLQVPQLWSSVEPVKVTLLREQRQWKIPFHCQSDFEEFVVTMIPEQIPVLYMEGYHELIEQTRQLPWPKNPKVIFTANALLHDTVSMAYTAEKVEYGSPLVYGQHGGFYGQALFIWAEDHERKIADKYITWGWTDVSGEDNKKIIPLGMGNKITKRVGKDAPTDLLLILASISRYTFRLDSNTGSNQMLEYIADCLEFAEALRMSDVYDALLVRMYGHEYGWNERSRWKDAHPLVRIDHGVLSIWTLVKKARLIVYSYNSTGYLQFMVANIPTVVFWDIELGPVRDSAIPYINDLKRVGIFHETPESAAMHVNNVWSNVDAWWGSPEVQGALGRFKKQYCDKPDNYLDRLESVFRNVIAESEKLTC